MVKMVNFMLCVFYHHFPKLLPMVNNKAGFTGCPLLSQNMERKEVGLGLGGSTSQGWPAALFLLGPTLDLGD